MSEDSPSGGYYLDAIFASIRSFAQELEASRRWLAGYLPALESMTALGGKATAYVCENYTCKLPTADLDRFAQLLQ